MVDSSSRDSINCSRSIFGWPHYCVLVAGNKSRCFLFALVGEHDIQDCNIQIT